LGECRIAAKTQEPPSTDIFENLGVRYKGDLALTSWGRFSGDLVSRVKDVLQMYFGFGHIETLIHEDPKDMKPYMDSEARLGVDNERLERIARGKHVVLLNYLKVNDNRLTHCANDIVRLAKPFYEKVPGLKEKLDELQSLAQPDRKNKIAPRFVSSRFHPHMMKDQIIGAVHALKVHGKARHISTVMPATIFELSHSFKKNMKEKSRYEMPMWDIFLQDLAYWGPGSVILVHPHARREGLIYSEKYHFNLVMAYPQTFTLNSNGYIISSEKFFSHFDLPPELFDPIRAYIEDRKSQVVAKYSDLNKKYMSKRKPGDRGNISSLFIYFSAPDKNAHWGADMAARRFSLNTLHSLKDRTNEGESRIKESESLESYLLELKKYTARAMITIFTLDDFKNTGNTTNDEAGLRKDQVHKFNKKYGTDYKVRIESIVTHERYPCIEDIVHDNIDRITLFDTIPYLPSMEDQLTSLGLRDKFNIIHGTEYQIAMAIVYDYVAQQRHVNEGRLLESGVRRRQTDQEIIHMNYAADITPRD